MKLDMIHEMWDHDHAIKPDDIVNETIRIPNLHAKYFKIFTHESMVTKKLEADMKELRRDKYNFYDQGPSKEDWKRGWEAPAKGGSMSKKETDMNLDADKDIINLSLKIALQTEKLNLLESILKTVANRSFHLRLIVDWKRFQAGQ